MAPQQKPDKPDRKSKKPPARKKKRPSQVGRAHRTYSDAEKAVCLQVLDSNRGNLVKTAAETGVPVATLCEWAHGRGVHQDVLKLRNDKSRTLQDLCEDKARLIMENLDEKIEVASLRDAGITAAILIDKLLALKEAERKAGQDPEEDGVELEQTDDHLIVKLRRASKSFRQDGTDGEGTGRPDDPAADEAEAPPGG